MPSTRARSTWLTGYWSSTPAGIPASPRPREIAYAHATDKPIKFTDPL
jgi:hypothetical protein